MINCHSFKISRIEHTSISSNKGSVDCADVFRNQIKGKQMNRFENVTKPLMWFMALLLTALVAGCGGGSQDPILGGGGIGGGVVPPPAVVPVAPGAGNCAAAVGNPLIPQILSSNPTDGNLNATPKTTGVAGKRITATFSLAMDPLTINDASTLSTSTFSLRETLSGNNVAGIVTMNATNPINTIATLETAAPLPAMSYTATITTAATAADTTPLACVYEWSFTVVTPPVEGLGAVDLGLAAPFGIASAGGVTNTATVPLSHIDGDAVLDPTDTCNAVPILFADGPGFGACGGFAPTITGTVVTTTYPAVGISTAILADFLTAYNSLDPASMPGATVLGCGVIGTGGGAGAGIGCAGAATLAPGVYISATATTIGVTGVLTLDGGGDSNAVFVFQAPTALTTAAGAPGVPGSQIVLTNGAKASNVWWWVGGSGTATIGTYADFHGSVLGSGAVVMGTGATSCGRLLAGALGAGNFVFDTNVVSVPGNPSAPPGCI